MFGPWGDTEFYINAGHGFHSNDARGTIATRDLDGHPLHADHAVGEGHGGGSGLRTVVMPHLADHAIAVDPATGVGADLGWDLSRIDPESGQ